MTANSICSWTCASAGAGSGETKTPSSRPRRSSSVLAARTGKVGRHGVAQARENLRRVAPPEAGRKAS